MGAQTWQETVSTEGGFSLWSPEKMNHKVDSIATPVGKIAWHTYFLQQANEEAEDASSMIFMMSYCDYPAYTVHSDSTELLEEFFESTIDQAVAAVEGELRYVTEQTLHDFPGRFWRIDYLDGEAVIKTRAFVVENRFYTVQVVSKRALNFNPASNRFFDSFKLLR